MTKNWINFRFLHICPVEKCEISPNLAKIHISPHLLCGKTEIPLHVEKFHVLKSEISPHGRFLLHLHVGDRGDKYQVCLHHGDVKHHEVKQHTTPKPSVFLSLNYCNFAPVRFDSFRPCTFNGTSPPTSPPPWRSYTA